MGEAKVTVSTDLIEQALHMPNGVEVVGAESELAHPNEITLIVRGEEIPEGVATPFVTHVPERYDWEWHQAHERSDPREIDAQ